MDPEVPTSTASIGLELRKKNAGGTAKVRFLMVAIRKDHC